MEEWICPICLCDNQEDCHTLVQCNHRFHTACIIDALRRSGPRCPCCRGLPNQLPHTAPPEQDSQFADFQVSNNNSIIYDTNNNLINNYNNTNIIYLNEDYNNNDISNIFPNDISNIFPNIDINFDISNVFMNESDQELEPGPEPEPEPEPEPGPEPEPVPVIMYNRDQYIIRNIMEEIQNYCINNNIDNNILNHLQELQNYMININNGNINNNMNNNLDQLRELLNYLNNNNNIQFRDIINMINTIYNSNIER
jgi:hypothetical protein